MNDAIYTEIVVKYSNQFKLSLFTPFEKLAVRCSFLLSYKSYPMQRDYNTKPPHDPKPQLVQSS